MRTPAPTRADMELAHIREQLHHLEYLDAENDRARRALQARRAQLLEQQEGCYAVS